MACPYRQFIISDGTTDDDSGILHAVDLLDFTQGFGITDWQMRTAETKSGGVWADSSLADGRFLKVSKLANVQEVLTVEVKDFNADGLAERLHALYDLLEQARNWGPSGWSDAPVWIEAVGVGETNARYALVHDYRTPGAGNPFGRPFWQTVIQSGISEFEIVLEREPAWRGNYPGDADCVYISAMQTMCGNYPLLFDGADSIVQLGSPAALDDLAVGASFTVEAWVYPTGWGEGNVGTIADKSNNLNVGWTFRQDNVNGLYGEVWFDTQNAESASGTDEWGTAQFNAWHHVAMVYTTGTKTITLWIDGAEVTSYATQQAGNAAAVADNAQTAQIGNLANQAATFAGYIGWVRISDTARYAAGFTEPPRCPLPGLAPAGSTQWLGIHEGAGTVIYDLTPNANNGTASHTAWGDCCSLIYGNYDPVSATRETSCDAEFVYVANKHNTIGLTHVWYYDANVPAFGGNLLAAALPYNLLPAVPAVGDRVYYGIQSTLDDAGPFCSIVHDLVAATDVDSVSWEYWNGAAWAALTVQDNTNQDGAMTGAAYDTAGVHSLHWAQPTSWSTSTVNGVTAWWIRSRVTGVGAAPVAPQQQNRQTYTVLWPYFEAQKDELYGNVPALARWYLANQSDNATAPRLYYNRVFAGLRSVSRGAYFTPYINLTDRTTQNLADGGSGSLTVSAVGTGAFASDVTCATGRCIAVTNPAAGYATVAWVLMNSTTLSQYQGTFHLFLRAYQTSGSAGDLSVRVWGAHTHGTPVIADALFVTDGVEFAYTNDWQVLDLGEVVIDTNYGTFSPYAGSLLIDVSGNGAADCKLYELILMPTDEFAVDAVDPYNTTNSRAGLRNSFAMRVNLDAVSDPRRWHAAVHEAENEANTSNWQGRAPEGPLMLPDTRQRVWFCSMRYTSTSTAEQRSEPWVCGSVQAWATERYLLMRGDE